ncbi:hypothetical protein [Haloarchaeobius baliensis]|uniref:hypothetical protein n=1 Tax=Haloarchaeobius baliensis TaxID=1670458 RepID=UPI003F882FAC
MSRTVSVLRPAQTIQLTGLAAILLAVLFVLPPTFAVLFVGVVVLFIGVLAYRLKNYLVTVFAAALLFRLSVIVGDTIVGVLPTPPIVTGHHERAGALAAAWTTGDLFSAITSITAMRTFVAHLLAPFYVILGDAMLVGRFAIAVFSLAVGYLIFILAQRAVSRRVATTAAATVLFWPTFVYRSVVIQREVLAAIVLLSFLWATVQWLDSFSKQSVLVAGLAVPIMAILREENLVLVAALLGTLFLIRARHRPQYIAVSALATIPFLVFFALNFHSFTGYGRTLSPSAIDAFAQSRARGSSAYLTDLHYETWLDIVLYAPLKVVYFLYTPFPWQASGVTETVVGVSAFGLLAMTVLARRGIGTLSDDPAFLTLLLTYLVLGVLTYSIVEMNYGAAVRRRIQFVPILLLLGVIGASRLGVNIRLPEIGRSN